MVKRWLAPNGQLPKNFYIKSLCWIGQRASMNRKNGVTPVWIFVLTIFPLALLYYEVYSLGVNLQITTTWFKQSDLFGWAHH